jgi:hypothetical protein
MTEPISESRGYAPYEPMRLTLSRRDWTILYGILQTRPPNLTEVQLAAIARFLAKAWQCLL